MTTFLLILIGVTTFAAAAGLTLSSAEVVYHWLQRREAEFARGLNELFFFDFSPRLAARLSLASVLSVGLFFYLFDQHVITGLVGAVVGFFLPMGVMAYLRRRRRVRLEDQLTDALLTIANGVRASLNLVQSMQLVEKNHPAPVSQEFGFLLREYEHGMSVEDAMTNAARRLASPNYRLLFSALRTNREKGGDLATTLDRIAESLREIRRLEEKIRTTTAQGRYSALFMGLMPFVFIGILALIDAEGMALVWEHGKWLAFVVAGLTAAGFAWIWRIVNIDV